MWGVRKNHDSRGLSHMVSKAGPNVCGYICCVSSGTTMRFSMNFR